MSAPGLHTPPLIDTLGGPDTQYDDAYLLV